MLRTMLGFVGNIISFISFKKKKKPEESRNVI